MDDSWAQACTGLTIKYEDEDNTLCEELNSVLVCISEHIDAESAVAIQDIALKLPPGKGGHGLPVTQYDTGTLLVIRK